MLHMMGKWHTTLVQTRTYTDKHSYLEKLQDKINDKQKLKYGTKIAFICLVWPVRPVFK